VVGTTATGTTATASDTKEIITLGTASAAGSCDNNSGDQNGSGCSTGSGGDQSGSGSNCNTGSSGSGDKSGSGGNSGGSWGGWGSGGGDQSGSGSNCNTGSSGSGDNSGSGGNSGGSWGGWGSGGGDQSGSGSNCNTGSSGSGDNSGSGNDNSGSGCTTGNQSSGTCGSGITLNGTAPTGNLPTLYGTAQTLEFTYNPGSTVSLAAGSKAAASITGSNSNGMAFLEMTNNSNPAASGAQIYFEGAVKSGENIFADATINPLTNTANGAGSDQFSTALRAALFGFVFTSQAAFLAGSAPIETINYATDASHGMSLGDTIGSIKLVGYVGNTGGHLIS